MPKFVMSRLLLGVLFHTIGIDYTLRSKVVLDESVKQMEESSLAEKGTGPGEGEAEEEGVEIKLVEDEATKSEVLAEVETEEENAANESETVAEEEAEMESAAFSDAPFWGGNNNKHEETVWKSKDGYCAKTSLRHCKYHKDYNTIKKCENLGKSLGSIAVALYLKQYCVVFYDRTTTSCPSGHGYYQTWVGNKDELPNNGVVAKSNWQCAWDDTRWRIPFELRMQIHSHGDSDSTGATMTTVWRSQGAPDERMDCIRGAMPETCRWRCRVHLRHKPEYVDVWTDSSDAALIDDAWIIKDGKLVDGYAHWGRPGGGGYCLSTDSGDDFGSHQRHCYKRLRFHTDKDPSGERVTGHSWVPSGLMCPS